MAINYIVFIFYSNFSGLEVSKELIHLIFYE